MRVLLFVIVLLVLPVSAKCQQPADMAAFMCPERAGLSLPGITMGPGSSCIAPCDPHPALIIKGEGR